jgi:tetratricopeptide (TPR) repeat protein
MMRNVVGLVATSALAVILLAHPAPALPGQGAICNVAKETGARETSAGCVAFIHLAANDDTAAMYAAQKLCDETGDKSPLEQRAPQCSIVVDWARRQPIKDISILTDALTNRCWAHILLGEGEPAKRDCADALAAEQENERGGRSKQDAHLIYAAKGALESLLGKYQDALDNENTAADYLTSPDPGYAYIFHNRGLTYRDLGQFDSALDDFNLSIRLDHGYMPAYLARGLEYERRGDLARAKDDFSKAIALPAGDFDFGHQKHATAEAHLKSLMGK